METLANTSYRNQHMLLWAIICSILLHLFAALLLPNFKFTPKKEVRQELKIELVNPKTEPKPEAPLEPPKPIEPEPIKPNPKPDPIKKIEKSIAPKPITEPYKEPAHEPSPPVQPTVIAATPKAEVKPTEVIAQPPPPEPPKTTGPSEGDIEAARNAYRSQVQRELKRNQRYPKIAESRGVQGEVKLEISVDNEGNVTDVSVVESSGNDSLDNAAKEAVRRSNVKQYMPDILRGHIDKLTVTVGFKLAE